MSKIENRQFCDWFSIAIMTISSLLMVLKLFSLTDEYAVNLIFWDQFDIYTPILNNSNLLEVFNWQHGPHRQGLGELLILVVLRLSGWNTRAEAFTNLTILTLCLLVGFILKMKILGKLKPVDVLIPLIILNTYQWEQVIQVPNVSHSILPLMLILVYVIAWCFNSQLIRYISILVLNFLLIFTGFGIFIGVVTPLILLIEIVSAHRQKLRLTFYFSLAALMISLFSIILFFIDYQFNPAVDCFSFQLRDLFMYPIYSSLILSNFFGIKYIDHPVLAISIGVLLMLFLITTLTKHLKFFLIDPFGSDKVHRVISVLVGFSLLFIVFAAVGRTCLGLESAQASRYMTLLIPGFLGLFFSLVVGAGKFRTFILTIFLGLFIISSLLPLNHNDRNTLAYYSSGKDAWKSCFIQTVDYYRCNELTGFMIYPIYDDKVREQLDYLEMNHLNLFQDN